MPISFYRLASLSEKNVQQDQRKVEDISGSNRPSELEKDFCAFFDEDRVDACIAMQTEYSRNDGDFVDIYYPRLACLILEVGGKLYQPNLKILEFSPSN